MARGMSQWYYYYHYKLQLAFSKHACIDSGVAQIPGNNLCAYTCLCTLRLYTLQARAGSSYSGSCMKAEVHEPECSV